MNEKKKIAIFGGGFNPIHKGHIQIITSVLHEKLVDEVWICPCYHHLWDKDQELISDEHRLNMCKMVADFLEGVEVFDYEIKHNLSGSTAELLKNLLRSKKFGKYDFYFIIGSDNIASFSKWKEPEWLKENAKFIVVNRKSCYPPKNKWFLKSPHIYLNSVDIMDISSTEIRRDLANNPTVKSKPYFEIVLCPPVLDYIRANKLY